MKVFMMAFLGFLFLGTTIYIKEDRFSKGRYTIYDENHQRTGYIIRDKLYPGKLNIYDRSWQREGYILEDNFNMPKITLDKTD